MSTVKEAVEAELAWLNKEMKRLAELRTAAVTYLGAISVRNGGEVEPGVTPEAKPAYVPPLDEESKTKNKILEIVAQGPADGMSGKAIADLIPGVYESQVQLVLKKLVAGRHLKKTGARRTTRYTIRGKASA